MTKLRLDPMGARQPPRGGFQDLVVGDVGRQLIEGADDRAAPQRLRLDDFVDQHPPAWRPRLFDEADVARHKLEAYFSILPDDSDIDLGGYSYRQFMSLYSALLQKALYHRYFAEIADAVGAIFIDHDEFVALASEDLDLSREVIEAILRDLVFDEAAGRAVGVENQIQTIMLNRRPRKGMNGKPYVNNPLGGGKTVLVVDDFCTQGNSFEAARAFLEKAGVGVVSLAWLKTINTDYRMIQGDAKRFIPTAYAPVTLNGAAPVNSLSYGAHVTNPGAASDLADLHARYAKWDWPA
jgi:hypothetical protein